MLQTLEVIRNILIVLFWICEVNVLYYIFLYIVGFIFHKQKYPLVEDQQKFCIFVPCHNEGPVIAATVENYTHINYSEDLFDIYFIADNCSDDTAAIIKEAIKKSNKKNFHVLVRKEKDINKRGKPHALRWAIESLENQNLFYNYYDMMIIFDADNFVDADILKHINSQYLSIKPKKRPVMIQCYLDSKNNNSLVARGYFQAYRVTNAFWQISKQKLHLMPAIGGTGFAATTAFLKEIGGYSCVSLTEDLEIQTIATIKNKRIEYNGNVRIYDEKPTKLKASFIQRTRWAQGHWWLFFKYVPILFLQLFNPFTIKNFFKKLDMIVYLGARLFGIISSITILLNLFYIIACAIMGLDSAYVPLWAQIMNIVILVFTIAVIPLSSLYDGSKEEKKHILRDLIPNVIGIYLVGLIDLIIGYPALFKCGNQKVWRKTTHSVTSLNPPVNQVAHSKVEKVRV